MRTLVHFFMRTGDLGNGFAGPGRPVEAIRVHQEIQKSRPSGYQPEVPVQHAVESQSLILEISGRIDGVYTDRNPVVIEEIKTLREHGFPAESDPLHWGQVKAYAHMYALKKGLDRVRVQLVYYSFESGATREMTLDFTLAQLQEFFDELVSPYIAWIERDFNRRQSRDESFKGRGFPYPEYRAGQKDMVDHVRRCIEEPTATLIEAPTGIGKTMAALYPAVRGLTDGTAEQVIYLTARTTGRLAAQKALSELAECGYQIKSLTLTAKEKLCPLEDMDCRSDQCPRTRGFYDRLGPALEDAFRVEALTREQIEAISEKHQICPFEFSLETSNGVDVIIGDYNYVFDPRVSLKRLFQERPKKFVFLVDEAHHLPDRARSMFSASLDRRSFQQLKKSVKGHEPALHRSLVKIDKWFTEAGSRCSEIQGPLMEKDPPADLPAMLREFVERAEPCLANPLPAPYLPDLLSLFFDARFFLSIHQGFDDRYVTLLEPRGRNILVRLFCPDPSTRLAEGLRLCKAAVFFSATLSPENYYRYMFGGNSAMPSLSLPSPFPRDNLCLMTADFISTVYRNRDRSSADLARILVSLVQGSKGNYLLFFPSYKYMDSMRFLMTAGLKGMDVSVQKPGMGEGEREEFLDRFQENKERTRVGFAVMGGIFGEGIDLAGGRLDGAAVVGVGHPAVTLENEVIRAYFEEKTEAGYAYAYLFPGMTRVLQAAGRVIRSESDRGVVLLIDERYGHRLYEDLFPCHWEPTQVRSPEDVIDTLEDFWRP